VYNHLLKIDMLNLPEQLLLLSYYEEKSALSFQTRLSSRLIEAVLAELVIQKRIKRKGSNLWCEDPSALTDPILNEALLVMTRSDESRSAKYWVNRLHVLLRRLRARLAEQLAAKGFLTIKDHPLGLFSFRSYQLTEPHPALELKDQLRQVLFQPFAPSPRQMALIVLVEPMRLKLFTREERRAVKARIGEILAREEISKAGAGPMPDAGVLGPL
jgi:hypothetical protein